MRRTLATGRLLVVDDFLRPALARSLWEFVQHQHFTNVHAGRRFGVYRPRDGDPFASEVVVRYGEQASQPSEDPVTLYPTKTVLDDFIRPLFAQAVRSKSLLGRYRHDWAFGSVRFFVYPAGTGVSWHTDLPQVGGFIYYLHPTWNVLWGGELMIVEDATLRQQPSSKRHHFENDEENAKLLRAGHGRFVMPKPNRLVMLKAGLPHMIAAVSPSAGHNLRVSIAGFFHPPMKKKSRAR
jgi:hypothetical protein